MSLLILWVKIKTLRITMQAKHCKLINLATAKLKAFHSTQKRKYAKAYKFH